MHLARHGQNNHHITYYHEWSYANRRVQWWSPFMLEDNNVVYLVGCATSSLERQILFQSHSGEMSDNGWISPTCFVAVPLENLERGSVALWMVRDNQFSLDIQNQQDHIFMYLYKRNEKQHYNMYEQIYCDTYCI
jgi:hypothetical protein